MNAPLKSTGSLKAAARKRLEQTSAPHLCRTFARTFAQKTPHLCSENKGQTCGDKTELMALCITACKGLRIEPDRLVAELSPEDIEALLSGEEGPETLKAFAGSIAESCVPELPAGVARAYTRLARTLVENPSLRFACENLPDGGGDYTLLAVGVKGAGYATLRMPKKKFDGFRLIKMVDRWNHEGRNPA